MQPSLPQLLAHARASARALAVLCAAMLLAPAALALGAWLLARPGGADAWHVSLLPALLATGAGGAVAIPAMLHVRRARLLPNRPR